VGFRIADARRHVMLIGRRCRVSRVCALEMLQHDSAGNAQLTIDADHLEDEFTRLERTPPRRPMA
jgi:hypothetical protein